MRTFDTLLIANRGEIACRIIRTARDLGLRTVAVYSKADARALHVSMADEAHHIGASQAAESYLNIDAILAAAKASGAGAIHPGYGFLSENATFARAVAEAGLTFIGPSPGSIEIMGDKAIAKAHMLAAGVPCVPGYQGADRSDATLMSHAQDIGVPLMVKAAAGGGGKGMRLVTTLDDLPEALTLARSEASAAFGNDTLILERAVQNARHIEIQVFADHAGNTIALGERDCSVQRRHQKVIEEAPAPGMGQTIRKRMEKAAIAVAKSVGYVGAGTVEFLLDQNGKDFYFLEMNTRLQVEHPVTEMVTGLDLVALQLAVAQGKPLPLSQEDVTLQGHAIEVRLYAEDPTSGFLPSIGKIHQFEIDNAIRVDRGVQSGDAVSPFYDPMLAKLVAYGDTRDAALRKLIQALDNTAILGVTTNLPFLRGLLDHPEVKAGTASTTFLDNTYPNGPSKPALTSKTIALATAQLLRSESQTAQRQSLLSDTSLLGFSSDGGLPIPLDLSIDGDTHNLTATGVGTDHITVAGAGDGWSHTISTDLRIDGLRTQAHHTADDTGGLYLQTAGHHLHVTRAQPWDTTDAASTGALTAPMPGLLVALNISAGDSVTKGDTLAVLEAMKMQHQLSAPADGIVVDLHAEAGQQLTKGALILTMEDPS
ncbi:acetyl/propionyl/methylcrotonyl-CoA carboxylase subunit alpha [Shimia sagamensis]|uniref:Geranyl-CoA carboxylase alpha subunit n=1 Tax=Shimia sagamensis TaxID=1566352 RepID=A0ABY1N8H2_9RHOB|nr:acetyl-CoA carboxylase biotin carboxylase subunit [Shimia sagamensis]SMP02963.1 geranyl-CoA carboxylase alpha subunit [Shimia sagamensis]